MYLGCRDATVRPRGSHVGIDGVPGTLVKPMRWSTSARPLRAIAAALIAASFAASACGQTVGPSTARTSRPGRGSVGRLGGGGAGGGFGSRQSPQGPPFGGGAPSPAPPVVQTNGALPLGTFELTAIGSDVNIGCETGEQCKGFQVSCPDVRQPAHGILGIGAPTGTARGVAVLFSGGLGTSWWGVEDRRLQASFLGDLHQHGIETVEVRWTDPWLFSSSGEQVGPAALSCRPATATKWIRDNIYASLGAHPALGACGFCIAGDSGGASQVAYTLADFGLAGILNAVFPVSGPPHAGLAAGCLPNAGEHFAYTAGFSAPIIDGSYGFFNGGPCQSHDAAWKTRWDQDAIDTGGRAFSYPSTRVVFIFGANDDSVAPPHGKLYLAKLQADRSPLVSSETVPGMGHLVGNSESGLNALAQAFLGAA